MKYITIGVLAYAVSFAVYATLDSLYEHCYGYASAFGFLGLVNAFVLSKVFLQRS